MYVINEVTRKWEYKEDLVRCVVGYKNGILEFGYVNLNENLCVNCYSRTNVELRQFLARYQSVKDYINFDRANGLYTFDIVRNVIRYGTGRFPYTFTRYYNTRFLNDTFKKWQEKSEKIHFKYVDEFPYTFGLEFETSAGYIPEHELFSLGLIPLRDGSIGGLEYSTIVLQGQQGLNSLYRMVECLKKYTVFDKECSLHIHLGNWKLDESTVLKLNNLFSSVKLDMYLPRDTFHTERYKATGKSYCKKNASWKTFNDLYRALVGRPYYGDLYQPHPADPSGVQKWHILSRYKALNLVNAVCYDYGKTAEFRILRPTYNFNKIICWLYIFAAFVKYAENNYRVTTSMETVLDRVYSPELASILKNFLTLEQNIVNHQTDHGDYIGDMIDYEDHVLTKEAVTVNENFFY